MPQRELRTLCEEEQRFEWGGRWDRRSTAVPLTTKGGEAECQRARLLRLVDFLEIFVDEEASLGMGGYNAPSMPQEGEKDFLTAEEDKWGSFRGEFVALSKTGKGENV